MGKILIIQGADFSANAVETSDLNWSYECGFTPTTAFITNATTSYYFANCCTAFENKYVNKIELIFTDEILPTLGAVISVSIKRNGSFVVLSEHEVTNDDITNKKVTFTFTNTFMETNDMFYFHASTGKVAGYSSGGSISPAQKKTAIVSNEGVESSSYSNLPIGVNYYGRNS